MSSDAEHPLLLVDDGGGRLQAGMKPDLMTVPEAARRLGIHPDTAYRLARTGQLPGALQVGTRWRVSVPRLERALHGDPGSPTGDTLA